MVALHWTPCTILQVASLRDVHEAYDAWHALQEKDQKHADLPARAFMDGMMQKFPDHIPAPVTARRAPHG